MNVRTPFTIKFKSSLDYIKLLLLLYAIALYAVYISALDFYWRSLLVVVLVAFFLRAIRQAPQFPYKSLSYHSQAWWLDDCVRYDKLSLRLDTGLFFLIVLSQGTASCKTLVIFRDQLPHTIYRHLRLILFIK